ncbi:DHA2 family efflux MFS transporter permease subunit [Kineococcus sp. R8]|uniref:DHA2 family efflux MFS transporter permease subunit n=1 Tax=Kineococcus siccus TaxID=2696567 RepID=UPI001411F0A3|nr:DHA2 family efflux MFS transporter permease subunit [Kineococcus siccus]
MTALPRSRRYLVLAICCSSLLLVSMDTTIVNVALPAIRADFGASLADLQWTIDAYTLVLASLLLLSGSTADRIGRRRTFQTGLVVFTLGSLLCSVAPGLGWLVAARVLQAVGGSMLNPVAMSIITTVFPDPRERARAIGIWAGVVGLALALGPVVGGLLTETIGWRANFWINVPLGVAALVLAAVFVPESRAARPRRLDPVGQVLVVAALLTLTTAIIEGPRRGWTSPLVLGAVAVAVGAVAGLARYEPRRRDPLLQVEFFRSAPFTGAVVTAVAVFATFGGFLFLNTLYLQEVRGFSPLDAGLATLPLALAALVAAPLSGRLVASRGARTPYLLAAVGLTAATLALTALSASTPLPYLLVVYLVFGAGFGMANSPVTNAAVSGMPREQAGVAAATASTSRQVGSALGVAVAGSIAGASGGAIGAGFPAATHPVWWIAAACGLLVGVLGVATTGRWARGTVERAAPLVDAAPGTAPTGAR